MDHRLAIANLYMPIASTRAIGYPFGLVHELTTAIQRLAVEHNVPALTTLEQAAATVEALQYLKFQESEALPVTNYVARREHRYGR